MKHLLNLPFENYEEYLKQYELILCNSKNGIAVITGVNLLLLEKLLKQGGIKFNSKLFLTIECKKLRKINRKYDGVDDHKHGIGAKEFYEAVKALNDPEFITRHNTHKNNYTIYTEALDNNGHKMLVGFSIDFVYKDITVNNIDTVFGYKEEKYIELKSLRNIGKRILIFSKEKGWLPAPNTSPTLIK